MDPHLNSEKKERRSLCGTHLSSRIRMAHQYLPGEP